MGALSGPPRVSQSRSRARPGEGRLCAEARGPTRCPQGRSGARAHRSRPRAGGASPRASALTVSPLVAPGTLTGLPRAAESQGGWTWGAEHAYRMFEAEHRRLRGRNLRRDKLLAEGGSEAPAVASGDTPLKERMGPGRGASSIEKVREHWYSVHNPACPRKETAVSLL